MTRVNTAYLPGTKLPDSITVLPAAELELSAHDLICLAVPARALRATMAANGDKIPQSAGVLVLSKGLVPPLGTLPSAFVAERCAAHAVAVLGGPADATEVLEHGAAVVLASLDRGFQRQLADALKTAGLDVTTTSDVTGVELASAAKNVAVLAAAAASIAGPSVAGAAAGKVFAEVDALAQARGGKPETFAGLAGAGDLVATVLAEHSRGHAVEGVDAAPLLASAARHARLQTPALDSLAALIEGRIEPDEWTATILEPARPTRKSTARAA
jgi:glycerol-3-phosphate dehydrogenase (NAD(P)+)